MAPTRARAAAAAAASTATRGQQQVAPDPAPMRTADRIISALRKEGYAVIDVKGPRAEVIWDAHAAAGAFFSNPTGHGSGAGADYADFYDGQVDEGRRMPRAGYWAKRGAAAGHRLLLKEGVDACRVPAPLTFEGAAGECIETGGVLLPEGRRAMDGAFGHMQRVAHDCLKAAAVALGGGLTMDDLAPLLDPSPLPYGHASASYLSALNYHAPVGEADADDDDEGYDVLAPEHVDGGLLTVIYSAEKGLQVNRPGFGWEDVPGWAARKEEEEEEEPCRLVVLVGAQLERATGGALKTVRHRVVVAEENDNDAAGSGCPPLRRSLVFRLRARHTAVLDPLKLAPKIKLAMPLLTDTATREPITVADFEEAFSASHPSINSDHQWQEEQQLLLEQERQQQGTPMRLFIKTLTGKTVTIPNIFPDDTVEFLKVEVAKREGIPPGQQRLIYTKAECQQMRDHTREDRRRPLSHYGVTDGAVIHLVLRLSGD